MNRTNSNAEQPPRGFSLVGELVRIAQKPCASKSTSLITTRRICRVFGERFDAITSERRAFRREAGKLRHHLPFTANKIYELQEQSTQHRKAQRADLRKVLAAFGRSLMLDTEGLTEGLGFDRLCDLLAVNTVEREALRKGGSVSVSDLVFAHSVEESAARRGQEWNDAPLFNACHMAFADFLHETPSELLPDPFAPGAPFGPKLPPVLTVVDGGKPQ
ncbi:hypothetical protein [Pseudomonas marginalis]|uniref:hypothetical protein n=1 Tax=Pseudomonas marginalis TaxID=298 RepID=UPI001285CB46|nr:hypothetical protein [Pseudomonas marginalis]KAA8555094.1 hypothetical protein FX984_01712 [Pseudomonas marginalis]